MSLSVKEIIDIAHKMKEYGCVLFGAGEQGRVALSALGSVEIDVKAVFDSVDGKEIDGRKAESLDRIEQYNSKAVCIVTPARNVSDVRRRLEEYFELVVDMQIIDWMMYMIPKSDDSIFTGRVILHPFNFYDSPYLSKTELTDYESNIDMWESVPQDIDLNAEGQAYRLQNHKEYFIEFQKALYEMPGELRYTEDNDMFSLPDAMLLHGMIREKRPKHIIEIGSGYSTFVMLDTMEYFTKEDCAVTCIEPYPDRLLSRLKSGDSEKIRICPQFVQSVPLETFQTLEAGDILFIDSSHVAKTGGDVLWELCYILPSLKPGVIIHIHDMFYPFVYPSGWLQEGRAYNEAFVVRALLMNSSQYDILIWNDMMLKEYPQEFLQNWCREYPAYGVSLWLQKR